MPRHAEDAIKLAILNHPQTFGLAPSEVNPMLMFVQLCIEQGATHGSVELWKYCFDAVNETLHHKVVEVFTGLSVIQGKVQDAAIAAESYEEVEPEPASKPEPVRKTGNGKPACNGTVIGSPGRELSTKQLRYLGYLIRQTGESPSYHPVYSFRTQLPEVLECYNWYYYCQCQKRDASRHWDRHHIV